MFFEVGITCLSLFFSYISFRLKNPLLLRPESESLQIVWQAWLNIRYTMDHAE
jgi:hypothetical protein